MTETELSLSSMSESSGRVWFEHYRDTSELNAALLISCQEEPERPEAKAVLRDLGIINQGIKAFEEEIWVEDGLGSAVNNHYFGNGDLRFRNDEIHLAIIRSPHSDDDIRLILSNQDDRAKSYLYLRALKDLRDANFGESRFKVDDIGATATAAIDLLNKARHLQRNGELNAAVPKRETGGFF